VQIIQELPAELQNLVCNSSSSSSIINAAKASPLPDDTDQIQHNQGGNTNTDSRFYDDLNGGGKSSNIVRVASIRHLRNWEAPDALVQEITPSGELNG